MPITPNYTIPQGSSASTGAGDKGGHQFFQNVEISPATLKDGSLVYRLNPKLYPQLGIDND
jgi:hypothetical protein